MTNLEKLAKIKELNDFAFRNEYKSGTYDARVEASKLTAEICADTEMEVWQVIELTN